MSFASRPAIIQFEVGDAQSEIDFGFIGLELYRFI
jgi:hypothetical protein